MKDSETFELPTGLQKRRRKLRPVGGIWKVLRFKTEAGAMTIEHAAFAPDRAIEKVAAVKLKARLGCVHL
jgi:hypothetical protein